MKGRVVIVTTGGTIAMRHDAASGGAVPAVSGAELVAAVPLLAACAAIEVVEFSNIPSPHMTPALMHGLALRVEELLADADVLGAVITHGTDTLEETACFLDLFLHCAKPVCLTAAMRHAGDTSPDGPINILCAVRVAASPEARGKGVLVVMNQEVHAACDVTKTHAGNVKTFASPCWGPLGYVDDDRVIFRRDPLRRVHIRPEAPETDVHLVALAAGADDFLLNCLIDRGVKGIVVQGFGRGNVPPLALRGMKRAVAAGIAVVVVTRCPGGRVLDAYAYEGGVRGQVQAGVIMGGELNGPKARIKLMLALGITRDPAQIAGYFDTE